MKTCTNCNEIKPLNQFDKKGNGHCSHCKTCRRKYVKQHYDNNKQYYKDKARKQNAKTQVEFIAYKESLHCTDCNMSFKDKHCLCDFHHIEGETKEYNVSLLRKSKRKMLAELKKCIPLCSNCHRLRHCSQG